MPIRRAADPSSVQLVLDAVRWTVIQRQQPDLQKICKYLQRVRELTVAQAELYVKQTVQDGLIVAIHKFGNKGCTKGLAVESYKIPTMELENPEDDGHDWYCIECHLGGDVIPCHTCHRVFHAECATNAVQKKLENNTLPLRPSTSINMKKLAVTSCTNATTPTVRKSLDSSEHKSEEENKPAETENVTPIQTETSTTIDSTKEVVEKKDEEERKTETVAEVAVEKEKCSTEENATAEPLPAAVEPETKVDEKKEDDKSPDVTDLPSKEAPVMDEEKEVKTDKPVDDRQLNGEKDAADAEKKEQDAKTTEKFEESKQGLLNDCCDENSAIALNDTNEMIIDEAISSSNNKSENAPDIVNSDATMDEQDQQYNYDVCSICNLLKDNTETSLPPIELNYLLNFTLNRIKSWLPQSITDTMSPEPKHEWLTEQEVSWRSRQLIYQPMDVPIMELKIRENEYNSLIDFHVDILTIQHNVAVYHGIESQEYGASEFMLQDCCYDLNEIKQCADCYRHSNEKTSSRWFCVPCRIPHELVWAKQKGYPHWPAKVIKKIGDQFDVRFFGAKHLRAVIPNTSIKPIDTKLSAMQIKRTSAFNKAYEELNLHRRLLMNPDEVKMLVHSSPKAAKPAVPRLPQRPRKVSSTHTSPSEGKTSGRKRKSNANLSKDVYEFNDASLDNEEASTSSSPNQKRKKSSSTSYSPTKAAAAKVAKTDKTSPTTSRTNKTKGKLSSKTKIGNKKTNNSNTQYQSNIIDISSGDNGDTDYLENGTASFNYQRGYDGSQELVTSSTEHIRMQPTLSAEQSPNERQMRRNSNASTQQLDRPYSDAVEKMRRQLEPVTDRNIMIKIAMDSMQLEMDRLTNVHSEQIRNMFEAHNTQLSETRKKQWCYNCEQEAIYHCCWNTAYCSTTCQQQHWQSEHKKVCRRKRV